MAKHFLDDFVKELDPKAKMGSGKDVLKAWYNPHGDSIEYQTTHQAIVAHRIDEFLTIYRSAVSREAIGFQLKDIQALLRKRGCDAIAVKAEIKGKKLIQVTGLLLSAYESRPATINRRAAYTSALNVAPREDVAVG